MAQNIDDLINALLDHLTQAQVERTQEIALVRYNRIKARRAQD
ncbi:MAG: hypothetical protein OXD43_03305 [Bacteroidetes bacterium]|nr:hypothetical protein [Bacteroidota bacterium]